MCPSNDRKKVKSNSVALKDIVIWDMKPCGSSEKKRRFGGIYGRENIPEDSSL
jgi:hypothetical protein